MEKYKNLKIREFKNWKIPQINNSEIKRFKTLKIQNLKNSIEHLKIRSRKLEKSEIQEFEVEISKNLKSEN